MADMLPLYDCKVGFRASDGPVVIHEAWKLGVTAAEVMVLQTIHGDDLVTNIRFSRKALDRPRKLERERLTLLYGDNGVREALGAKSAKLPTELDDSIVAPSIAPKAAPEPDHDPEPDPEPEPVRPRGKTPIKVG